MRIEFGLECWEEVVIDAIDELKIRRARYNVGGGSNFWKTEPFRDFKEM
jgi:hypothetical protein